MRTKNIQPDLEQIEKRKNIVPFGKAVRYEVQKPTVVPFVLYTTEQDTKTTNAEVKAYRPENHFKATTDYKMLGEVSVRITNIPLKMTQNELFEMLLDRCKASGLSSMKLKPFSRLALVFDKETKVSRGLAYANCLNVDIAKDLAKVVRAITIEEYVLCAEVLNN